MILNPIGTPSPSSVSHMALLPLASPPPASLPPASLPPFRRWSCARAPAIAGYNQRPRVSHVCRHHPELRAKVASRVLA